MYHSHCSIGGNSFEFTSSQSCTKLLSDMANSTSARSAIVGVIASMKETSLKRSRSSGLIFSHEESKYFSLASANCVSLVNWKYLR